MDRIHDSMVGLGQRRPDGSIEIDMEREAARFIALCKATENSLDFVIRAIQEIWDDVEVTHMSDLGPLDPSATVIP